MWVPKNKPMNKNKPVIWPKNNENFCGGECEDYRELIPKYFGVNDIDTDNI